VPLRSVKLVKLNVQLFDAKYCVNLCSQNEINVRLTSCAGGRHNMPPPPASWPLTF